MLFFPPFWYFEEFWSNAQQLPKQIVWRLLVRLLFFLLLFFSLTDVMFYFTKVYHVSKIMQTTQKALFNISSIKNKQKEPLGQPGR